jgi:hypothetical protein
MKKLFVILIVVTLLTFFSNSALANGGPGDGKSLLIGGNISFENTPDIFVVSENLNINIGPYSTVVTVEYTLKNTGAAKELDYIFPVTNYLFDMYDNASLEWIAFYDNGYKLEYMIIETEELPDVPEYQSANLEDNSVFGKVLNGQEILYYKIRNSYYHTKLKFTESETKNLTVSYKTDNSYTSWGTSKYPLNHFSDVIFLYDFRPAAFWGNGKTEEFNLRVDYAELYLALDININIGSFQRSRSGVFTYSAKNFDFADAEILSIIADYPFEYKRTNNSTQWLQSIYVSSTLPSTGNKYTVENLFDNNLNTVWSTAGNGIGTVIEIKLEEGYQEALSLGILNGFVRSRELYYDNSRIKTIKVATFYAGKVNEYTVELPDIPYEQINKDLPMSSVEIFPVSSPVRLTIMDVYPGRKYNDVCLSQLYQFGWYGPYEENWAGIDFEAPDKPFIIDLLSTESSPPESTISDNSPIQNTPNPGDTAGNSVVTEPSATTDDTSVDSNSKSGNIILVMLGAIMLSGAVFFIGVLFGRRKYGKKDSAGGNM